MAVAVFALIAAAATVRAADADVKTGDWWEYTVSGDLADLGVNISGTVKLEVGEVIQESVMGQVNDVFVVDYTGSASFSGEIEGLTVSANVTMGGEEHRLVSNFSMTSLEMMMSVDMHAIAFSMSMDMGMITDFDPVMDDYPGDADLASGTAMRSRCEMITTSWTNFMGSNDSDTSTDIVDVTMQVTATDVEVSTPAGTFKCYEIVASGETPDDPDYSTTYYYSDDVGNFVKVEGDGDMITGFSTMTLKAFSHGGGGSILSGTTGMLVIGLVVIAAVIIAAVLMLMRGRGKTPAPVYPPQPTGPQPEMPPPPPSQ